MDLRDSPRRLPREFVVRLQAIADGLARGDMKAVASASRTMGIGRAHDVPLTFMGKLPLEFRLSLLACMENLTPSRWMLTGSRYPRTPLVSFLMRCTNASPAITGTRLRAPNPSYRAVELDDAERWPRTIPAWRAAMSRLHWFAIQRSAQQIDC